MGPLTGYRVIEMKGIGPGPYAGMLLADLGAEVIVVERSTNPNPMAPPSSLDITSRGKKSVVIDLKTDSGVNCFLELVKTADALFEGYRPGVAEKLGIGPDKCLEINPSLIYGRMTGWGQTGPLAHSAGHDLNYISITGAASAIGTPSQPVPPLNLIGDFASGSMFLVIGMLSALLESKQSGKGQVVDASITDGSAHLMSVYYTLDKLGMWTTKRGSNVLDGGSPFYRTYETKDNLFVSVGSLEPHFFAELVEILQLPKVLLKSHDRPQDWPELHDTFANAFKLKTRKEWVELFEGTDACVAGVLDYQEAPNHPHNLARQTYIEVGGVVQPAPAPRFSRTICETPEAPHAEGEDTHLVLAKLREAGRGA